MALTPSEVASLSAQLSWWETAEYVFTGLVALACFGEYAADFTNWFTGEDKVQKERLAKISTLLLIASLALELLCLVRTNQLSGTVVGALGDRAMMAFNDADAAVEQASEASRKAQGAEEASTKAFDKAGLAETIANGAMVLARGANKDLADALKQAQEAKAVAEKERLAREPRVLAFVERNNLLSEIRGLDNTIPYRFASPVGNPEAKTYGDVIASVFTTGGLRVINQNGLLQNTEIMGIWVAVSPLAPQQIKDAATKLLMALRNARIPRVNRFANTNWGVIDATGGLQQPPSVEILIGRKPEDE